MKGMGRVVGGSSAINRATRMKFKCPECHIAFCSTQCFEVNKRLIQKVSTVCCKENSSKVSYKILLLSDSTFYELFSHIFAAIIEAFIVEGHKFLYILLIECGRLRC